MSRGKRIPSNLHASYRIYMVGVANDHIGSLSVSAAPFHSKEDKRVILNVMENSFGLSPHAIEFTPLSLSAVSYKENQIVVTNEKDKVYNSNKQQYEYINTVYQSYQKEKKSSRGGNKKKNRKKKEDIRKIVNRQLTLNDDTIEATVNVMEEHNIDAYLVQETNMRGSWEKLIERDSGSYLILHHNHDEDANGKGVAIFLSPAFVMSYERAGRVEPITTDATSQFCGRFIGIWISYPNYDSYGKRIRGDMKLFLASAHYPKSNTSFPIWQVIHWNTNSLLICYLNYY